MSELADSKPSGRKSPMSPAPKLPKLKTKKKEVPAEEKTGGSRWKRYVGWGVIALLALGVVAEFRAQLGFRKTLATCNGAFEGKTLDDTKRITFDELKSKLPPDPVHTKAVHSFAQSEVYTWTWQGIRRYKVQLFVNPKDGAVWDVNSEP
jgi:hypothetical protein